jgi:uncharacterized phiE125 gp8 family phage protein
MSTPITLASKDPNEAYSYTWTPQAGDTIASGLSIMPTVGTATLEATPSPINDNEAARFVLLGGADGEITRLTARATMASGDIVEQEIRIPIISSGRRCIDLAMAKQHLEYEDDDRDALIQQYIDAAQAWVEDFTGKLLFRRTIPQRFPSNSASLRFHVGPSAEVESLKYLDSDFAEQIIDPADYRVVGDRLYPVTTFPYARHGIEAAVTAGYDGDVPAPLISAQLLLIGHWFANRETVVTGTIATSLPFGADALCAPYRSTLV